MQFGTYTANSYPVCSAFVRTELQPRQLKQLKPKVFVAFVKACESERMARIALEFYSTGGPTVEAADDLSMKESKCGLTPDNVGFIRGPITIDRLLFQALEVAVAGDDRQFAKLHFEATFLHELVHWARAEGGLIGPIFTDPPLPTSEAGEVFEIWAYQNRRCTLADVERLKAIATKGNVVDMANRLSRVWAPNPMSAIP